LAQNEKKTPPRKKETAAALDAPAASLRSENCRVKSAVEMTPRGKRGKLKNPKASFPLFPPGLEIRQKQRRRISTFPPRRRRLYILREDKNETENKFQLTDLGQFKDHEKASVVSLRS
jgi:hypothetical protein